MSHILEFLDLVDVPDDYSTAAGYTVAVNSAADALEFVLGVNANAIQGADVQSGTPSDGQVLLYDGVTDNRWELTTPPWLNKAGGTMTGFITLHNVPTSAMHAANKGYIDDNFSASSHGHGDDEITLSGTHSAILNGATYVSGAMTALDDLEDDDIPLSGTHSYILSGETTVAGAMAELDALEAGDIQIGFAYSNILSGDTDLGNAMTTLDGLGDSDIPLDGTHAGFLDAAATLGDAMVILDEFKTGMDFDNGAIIRFETVTPGFYTGFNMDTSDYLNFGYAARMYYVGQQFEFNGDVLFRYDDKGLKGKDAGDDTRNIAEISSSDILAIGDAAIGLTLNANADVEVVGGGVILPNNEAFSGTTTGAAAVNLATLNSSDAIVYGQTSVDFSIYGFLSGGITIDNSVAGAQDIFNTWTGALTGPILKYDTVDGFEVYSDIYLANNNTGLHIKDSSNANQNAISLNGSDMLSIGYAGGEYELPGFLKSNGLYVEADDVVLRATGKVVTSYILTMGPDHELLCHHELIFDNAHGVEGENVAGTARNLIKIGASDIIRVGDDAEDLAIDGVIVEDVTLENNIAILGEETGGTARNLVKMGSGNVAVFGSTSNTAYHYTSGTAWFIGTHIRMDNARYLYGLDSGSTARTLLGVNASDLLVLGNPTTDLSFGSVAGTDLSFRNAQGIRGITTGAASRMILRLGSGDDVQIGNASNQLTLISDGEVDAGANDITTTGEVIAAEADVPHIRASSTKTLTDSTYVEFARAFLENGTGRGHTACLVYYEIVAETTIHSQVETGFVSCTMVRSSGGTNTSGTTAKAANSQALTGGTLTVAFSTGNAGADHQRLRVSVTSDLTTPTLTGYFTIIGNNDTAITWS